MMVVGGQVADGGVWSVLCRGVCVVCGDGCLLVRRWSSLLGEVR